MRKGKQPIECEKVDGQMHAIDPITEISPVYVKMVVVAGLLIEHSEVKDSTLIHATC